MTEQAQRTVSIIIYPIIREILLTTIRFNLKTDCCFYLKNNTVQLHRRHSLLGLGDQIHGLKPHRQRQFGGLENGARRDRSLTMALVALAQLSGMEMATVAVTAVRAFEAVRPAPFEERVEALLFGAVEFEKFVQTEAFLKLNLIALHGDTSLLINSLHTNHYTTEAAYEWW